jgi:hypothetical protein
MTEKRKPGMRQRKDGSWVFLDPISLAEYNIPSAEQMAKALSEAKVERVTAGDD